MADFTDLYAVGCACASTDSRVNTTSTDATTATTSLGDYLILFPFTPASVPSGQNAGDSYNRGILYAIDGMNTTATEKYLWIFDYTPIYTGAVVPANGNLPIGGVKLKHVLDIPPNTTSKGQFGFQVGTAGGEQFKSGLVLVVSTSPPPTLTLDTAAATFISCEYGAVYPGYTS